MSPHQDADPGDPRIARIARKIAGFMRPAGAVLTDWYPEAPKFRAPRGRAIARRNLWISIPPLLLSFAIWQVWSVVVAKLPLGGLRFTTDQLFWLAAPPGISSPTPTGPQAALWAFPAFACLALCVSCVASTWIVYARKGGFLYNIERTKRDACIRPPAAE